ncbi:MAG: EVE domain-containing protein [Actinomycetota bacterium]|nr:EVE domain-containing protein [Actinomycetota bacterium]
MEAGATVSGFRERRRKTVQRIKPGDYLLCYLTGVSRFIGVLEVTSELYRDETPIWKDEAFPCRVTVEAIAALTPETAVPIFELKEQLTIFQNLKSTGAWTGHVRGSPAKWKDADGEAVVYAVMEAVENPVKRPVDASKLARRPKAFIATGGTFTVPEGDNTVEDTPKVPKETLAKEILPQETTAHTEIQWLLLKLGSDMGLDVWVAKNDRHREANGHKFDTLPRLKKDLPLQFDEVTNRTIELIDVLWLRGNAIIAAFEIESTTSIYSGLLRMSDLITMQPNLNIPLYIVAPDERREKVISEVNRPTFSRRTPPMNRICSYISFSALRQNMDRVAGMTRYLKPEFLQELAEPCVPDEA